MPKLTGLGNAQRFLPLEITSFKPVGVFCQATRQWAVIIEY